MTDFLYIVTVGLKFTEIVVFAGLSLILLVKAIQFRALNLIALMMTTLVTAFQTVASVLPLTSPSDSDQFYGLIFTLSIGILFPSLLVFIDYYDGELTLKRSGIALSGFAVTVIFFVFGRTDPSFITVTYVIDGRSYFSWSETATLVYFPLMMYAAYVTYDIVKRSMENTYNDQQRRQLGIMRTGFYLAIVGTALVGIPGSIAIIGFGNELWFIIFIYIIQGGFLTVGMAIVTYGYLSVDQIAFLQPQALRALLVIEKNGLPLYDYTFKEGNADSDAALISGALTAISALLGEAFGVSTNIKSINFADTELLLEFDDRGFVVVVIAAKVTNYLRESAGKFTKAFGDTFEDDLNGLTGDFTVFSNAEPILLQSFGFA